MATGNSVGLFDYSFYADQNFSTCGQYRFVVAASTQGYVALATTANASVLGVIQNNPAQNEIATVRLYGTTRLSVDSASAASIGKYLKTGSDGQALGYQSLSACVMANAIALENVTSGSGVEVECLLITPGIRG